MPDESAVRAGEAYRAAVVRLQPRPTPVRPGPGQESVWDFPRPPRVEDVEEPVEVFLAGRRVASTRRAKRVCETASPPVYYVPRSDVDEGVLERGFGRSTCEWKGPATYWSVVVEGARADDAAWSYEEPWEGFEELAGWLAFYPGAVECRLGGERVRAQEGGFYGGWVADRLVGPWKGAPGTGHW